MNEIFEALEDYKRQYREVGEAMEVFEASLRGLHSYYSNVKGEVTVKEIKKRAPRKKRVDNGEAQYGTA